MLIAQISDIHAYIRNDHLGRFERAVAWLDTLRPDLLVISGDLIEPGWPEGYVRIADTLRRLPFRTLVLPGNSDDKILMRARMPEFVGQGEVLAMHFSETFSDATILGLDATVEGAAYGDLTGHVPWLMQKLADMRETAPLLFLHHHVFPCGISPMDEVMCRGTNHLIELLLSGAPRPLAICTGHVHRPMASVIAGLPTYICGSICPANPLLLSPVREPSVTDPPALMVHQTIDGKLVSNHISLGCA